MAAKKIAKKKTLVKATKKKIVDPKAALEIKIAEKKKELYSLQDEMEALANDGRDETLEMEFIKDFDKFQKSLAPQVKVIKAAQKQMAQMAEKAGLPAQYELEEFGIIFTYTPKSFNKKHGNLHEDFIYDFCEENRIDDHYLNDGDVGWTSSYT